MHDFYGKDLSEFALSVWWQAMRPFDLAAVRDAMSRHLVNPDTGQFMPKPADIVRMIGGRTVDAAQLAWSKVDAAVRRVGTYASVVFDDPLVHRVVDDMGGWIPLGRKSEDEWPFVAREFENRYRGYAMRQERPEYPSRLIGISEAANSRSGLPIADPVLIGAPEKARAVLARGSASGGGVRVLRLADAVRKIA
ncbi:DUF6475 domain-containing protein [Quisquiliibacterium transsilvanicum]|uniref:DUF6475 domain-containing protein n=1 Tax=Quisquiliibacterium transsilvanicum TaxID=1549638 RepID=A0A7W8HHI1_9BURK|nr:hypothetical protein [Quisquiliibacterium transsilvanicum]